MSAPTKIPLYDAREVSLVIDNRIVQGFQENDMAVFTAKEDRIQTSVDAQGYPSAAVNNNHLSQLVVNLSGNSIDHQRLTELANNSNQFAVTLDSPIETITANQCFITKVPDSAYGKSTPARTYTIEMLDANYTVHTPQTN
ncbi:hypothetical protein [Lacticaseibacillus zhaodongensis]|uniref:hypothetical protein n=1 Tax=Lacticaseibacillus zhaodongensis TaxID=2668065 RepID=UPI0012D341AC|nr:hypothetical protein [Lacticaseibacillus zhaodongensis]